MEAVQGLMRLSDRVFKLGIDHGAQQRELGHAELKREIARRVADDFGGSASASEIKKSFKHNTKHKKAIDDALEDMVSSEMLRGKGHQNRRTR